MQAYTSADLIEINGRQLTDLADGDCVVITFPNELSALTTGKNGNNIASHNETGRNAEVALRIVAGSNDDKFLNSIVNAWKDRLDTFEPMTADFSKLITVDGGKTTLNISCSFGIPVKDVETKENVEGDKEQGVSVYNFRFGDHKRSLS